MGSGQRARVGAASFPENSAEDEPDGAETAADENLDPDAGKSQQQVIDEMTGQLNLFTNDTNEET